VKLFLLYAAVILLSVGASSCQRKKEDLFKQVDADVWLHEVVPPEVCEAAPALKDLGVYRKVRCTDAARVAGLCGPEDKYYEEFISYCTPQIEKHISMVSGDFKKWIDVARKQIDECLQ